MNEEIFNDTLTIYQSATYLKTSYRKIREYIAQGLLKAEWTPKQWVIKKGDLDELKKKLIEPITQAINFEMESTRKNNNE